MAAHFQVLALIVVVVLSVLLTGPGKATSKRLLEENRERLSGGAETVRSPNLSFQTATLKIPAPVSAETTVRKEPVRNWNVLDPKVTAAAVLIQSLDDNLPFFYHQTYQSRPMASLTKLLTAIVALEEIGANKKIEITPAVIATEGNGGAFQAGEIYAALDLVKIMLVTSSNDAAAAFENYYGREALAAVLNEKARDLQMLQTKIYDASGLDDNNTSNATDLAKLMKYILERQPEILNWSRLPSLLVQPINKTESRSLQNINFLAADKNFWGGKTGTSEAAGENLAAIFSLRNRRVLLILLGSRDRVNETERLLKWVEEAYEFD